VRSLATAVDLDGGDALPIGRPIVAGSPGWRSAKVE